MTQREIFDHLGSALGTDFFSVAEQFSDEQWERFIDVRRFVDHEVIPVAGDYWERAELAWPLIERLAELNIAGGSINGYGCPDLSPLTNGLVQMELSRGDGSLATFFVVHSGLAMQTISVFGSDEQQRRWLPAMARMEKIGAFALTEPEHGSDSIALESSARRDGADWVLDGQKRWIGNATVADVIMVWARNAESGEVNGFLVERDMPGFTPTVIPHKGSLRGVWQADIELTGVRVPEENRLPGAERFADAGTILALSRSSCAWMALGHATAGYEAALNYAKQRTQFGKPLASFQIMQQRLVRMLAELTGMQLYCMQVAKLETAGALSPTVAGLAKMNNTRKAREILAEARDAMGGNGILLNNHVIRHMADIESVHTFEGTETVQTLIVGRDITGVSAFT